MQKQLFIHKVDVIPFLIHICQGIRFLPDLIIVIFRTHGLRVFPKGGSEHLAPPFRQFQCVPLLIQPAQQLGCLRRCIFLMGVINYK